MSDSPPFRARDVSPADRAVERIDAETKHVRERSNRFALADATFVTVGAVLLAWSMLVLLAFRLGPQSFAALAWLIFAAVVVIAWRKTRQAGTRWMPAATAAVVIDERARLEDRLATIASTTEAARGSRLWSFLLHENLRLLPSWEAKRFVPRAMPRSVWFFVAALAVFVIANWLTPRSTSGAAESSQEVAATSPPGGESPGEDTPGEGNEDPSSLPGWTDLPEAIRQAILGKQSSQTIAGKIPQKTAALKDDKGGPAIVGDRMSNHGPPKSMPRGSELQPSGQPGTAVKAPRMDGKPPDGAGANAVPSLARGDAPKTLPPAQAGSPKDPKNKSGNKGTSGGSGGGGAGAGSDPGGLYGAKQGPGKATGSFALDLDALQSDEASKEGEAGDGDVRVEGELAQDQRLDDAIRRAQVPVEYEKIVQRIFSRANEEEPKP